jgi:hypothetical protein
VWEVKGKSSSCNACVAAHTRCGRVGDPEVEEVVKKRRKTEMAEGSKSKGKGRMGGMEAGPSRSRSSGCGDGCSEVAEEIRLLRKMLNVRLRYLAEGFWGLLDENREYVPSSREESPACPEEEVVEAAEEVDRLEEERLRHEGEDDGGSEYGEE